MYVLVAIPDPHSDRFKVVVAEHISGDLYKLFEDVSPGIGYKFGDLVRRYGETSDGLPKVERISLENKGRVE